MSVHSSVFRVDHGGADPAEDIRKAVGDISQIRIGPGKLLLGIELFSVPLILLIVGVFYLGVYVRRCSPQPATTGQ